MNSQDINIYDLIIEYLSDSLSEDNKESVEQWIKESDENKNTFNAIKIIWESDNENLKSEYANWDAFKQNLRLRKQTVLSLPLSRIAIAAVIIVLIGMGWFNRTQNEELPVLQTNNKCFLTDTLKNGWIVYLYPNSELSSHLNQKNIEEYKFSGEGFFIVPENSGQEVSIRIGDANIQVNGTSFRVNSCKQDNNFSVLVEAGHLELNSNKQSSMPLLINAGEQGYYSCTNKTIWKDQKEEEIYLIYQPNIVDL